MVSNILSNVDIMSDNTSIAPWRRRIHSVPFSKVLLE
jgi:hypothetical protein